MYLQRWFHDNYTILNPGKCYYMTFGLNTTKSEFVLEDGTIDPSAEEYVVLGTIIDSRLTFYSHLKQLCKKVANKVNVLTRIAQYLSYSQRRLIYSSFFYLTIKLMFINMDLLFQAVKLSYKQTSRTSS